MLNEKLNKSILRQKKCKKKLTKPTKYIIWLDWCEHKEIKHLIHSKFCNFFSSRDTMWQDAFSCFWGHSEYDDTELIFTKKFSHKAYFYAGFYRATSPMSYTINPVALQSLKLLVTVSTMLTSMLPCSRVFTSAKLRKQVVVRTIKFFRLGTSDNQVTNFRWITTLKCIADSSNRRTH